MTVYAVLVLGDVDDPVGAVEKMLDGARIRPLEGLGWILEADEVDPRRARTRARQARYRARRRDARDADPRDARDAAEGTNSHPPGGVVHSLSPLPGEERESETPKRDANDARRARRDDATRRDADDGDDLDLEDYRDDDQPGSPWRIPPLTDDERAEGQKRVRELRDQLHRARGES